MQAYSDPNREQDPHALPDFEVFPMTMEDFLTANPDTWMYELLHDSCDGVRDITEIASTLAGWYYWPCFPGCLPDSDPVGPFETEQEAIEDLRSYNME